MSEIKAMPKFITLEGIDGAGKSTHLSWLQSRLSGAGIDLIITREPGGTALGEQLREILLHQPMHLETEALLMFAARREHIDQVIKPALDRGAWVVSDRFSDASFAYQGGGRGVDSAKLEQLEQWVHPNLQPDLTLLFDVPVEVSQARLSSNQSLDRFEQERSDFFNRVREAYLLRAKKYPQRFHVIDSTKPLTEVQQNLEQIIAMICR